MNYIPDEDDIGPVELAYDVIERVGLAQAGHEAAGKLLSAIESGGSDIAELVNAAKTELVFLCELRMLALTPMAQDAIEDVLQRKVNAKKGAAVVKAAEIVFDRGAFPKRKVGATPAQPQNESEPMLPTLDSLLDGEESPDDIMRIVRQKREIMAQIAELRQGARMIIDVVPSERAQEKK